MNRTIALIRETIGSYLNALQNLILSLNVVSIGSSQKVKGYNSGVFIGVSSEIRNDLIECIDSVIQDQIDKEIENCRFLSIQVDETADVSTKEVSETFSC